jgi:hypothetical protein
LKPAWQIETLFKKKKNPSQNRAGGRGEVAQIMCTHVSKCKNVKIKKINFHV